MTYEFSLFDLQEQENPFKGKPIRLIEMFGGYGSQLLAMKYLGLNVEHWKLIEWGVPSIWAYNHIHTRDFTDYSKGMTREEVCEKLFAFGISADYDKPMKLENIKRRPEDWQRKTYNDIIATKNLVNIMSVRGGQLEIKDKDKYTYVVTYSFPCQDISLAGKCAGFSTSQAQGGTRSGLLWEVERILNELDEKPQVLLMENVKNLLSDKYFVDFQKWLKTLENMGYMNFYKVLNSAEHGIPQNRERVFMMSILDKEFNYQFPKTRKLEIFLKNVLEKNVDEKYFLTERIVKSYYVYNERNKEKGNGFKWDPVERDNADKAKTILTRGGDRPCDNFIIEDSP